MNDEEKNAILTKCLDILSEHFEAVQIMACDNEAGESKAFYRGAGIWYARMGMAHEFIENDRSQITARDLSEAMKPEEE